MIELVLLMRGRKIADNDEEAATKKRAKSERKREKERKEKRTRFKAICYFNWHDVCMKSRLFDQNFGI